MIRHPSTHYHLSSTYRSPLPTIYLHPPLHPHSHYSSTIHRPSLPPDTTSILHHGPPSTIPRRTIHHQSPPDHPLLHQPLSTITANPTATSHRLPSIPCVCTLRTRIYHPSSAIHNPLSHPPPHPLPSTTHHLPPNHQLPSPFSRQSTLDPMHEFRACVCLV